MRLRLELEFCSVSISPCSSFSVLLVELKMRQEGAIPSNGRPAGPQSVEGDGSQFYIQNGIGHRGSTKYKNETSKETNINVSRRFAVSSSI